MVSHPIHNAPCTDPVTCKYYPACDGKARDAKSAGPHQVTPEGAARANELLADAHRYRRESEIFREQIRTLGKLEREAIDLAARKQVEASKILLGPSYRSDLGY